MIKLHKHIIQKQSRHVPSQIQIPCNKICNLRYRMEWMTHCIAGKGRRSCRIQFFHKFLEFMMIIQHVSLMFMRDCNFIRNPPCHNTWMIVILHNQFPHLEKCILPSFRHMRRNIRYLSPDNHSISIAKIIKILIVLIMCKPNRIGANLTNQIHILLHMFFCNGISQTFPILMSGNPTQRIRLSI